MQCWIFQKERQRPGSQRGEKKKLIITDSADDVTEISQEEVVEKASALLERLYGVNADTLTIKTEHDQASDGNGETFTTDTYHLSDEAAGISYLVSVNLQNGEIRTVSVAKDTGSNYSKEIAENATQYQELFFRKQKRWRMPIWEKCCMD